MSKPFHPNARAINNSPLAFAESIALYMRDRRKAGEDLKKGKYVNFANVINSSQESISALIKLAKDTGTIHQTLVALANMDVEEPEEPVTQGESNENDPGNGA